MNVSRALAAAVTLNGNIFVMGGQNANVLNSVERYDPTSNVWTLCANMNNEYTSHGVSKLLVKNFEFINKKINCIKHYTYVHQRPQLLLSFIDGNE